MIDESFRDPASEVEDFPREVVSFPIDGTLDLHQFNPKDICVLLTDYIELCLERGILSIRVIHGKGKGVLRKKVHAMLARNPSVVSFTLSDGPGSWGATIVELNPNAVKEKGD